MKDKNGVLVAFCGLKGAGKDTAAQAVIDRGYDGRIYKFATPLKEMAAGLLRVPVEMLEGETEESRAYREGENALLTLITGGKIKTPRYLLQWLGTEVGRQLHTNIWVDLLKYRLLNDDFNGIHLITDCRFRNEIWMVKKLGGLCVLIEREGLEAGKDKHESEAMPFKKEDFDLTINNAFDLKTFKQVAGGSVLSMISLKECDAEKFKIET